MITDLDSAADSALAFNQACTRAATEAMASATRAADAAWTSAETRDTPPRYDMYVGIHKGLRALMTDTLVRIGRTDPTDRHEVAAALEQLRALVRLCRVHLIDENEFVHPALDAVSPGFSRRIAGEHVEHTRDLDALDASADAIEARHDVHGHGLTALYRQLSVFVAHNLEHMAYEETHHNRLLWQGYTDAELADIEHALVASIDPAVMSQFLRWMLPSMSHPQRLGLLCDMRRHAPPAAFEGVLGMLREQLSAADWIKLDTGLAQAATGS